MVDIISATVPSVEAPKVPNAQPSNSEFADALKGAVSAQEARPQTAAPPDSPPKASPPPVTSPPIAESHLQVTSTEEVKPNEPIAQANVPDSPLDATKNPSLVQSAVAAGLIQVTQSSISANVVDLKGADANVTPLKEAPAQANSASPLPSTEAEEPVAKDQQHLQTDSSTKISNIRSASKEELANFEIKTKPADSEAKVNAPAKSDTHQAVSIESNDTESSESDSSDSESPNEDPSNRSKTQTHSTIVQEASTSAKEVSSSEKLNEVNDLSNHQRNLVIRQVADRIELLAAARPRDGVVIHLQPAELGQVTLLLRGDKSDLQAQVLSENERVRTALQQSHPDIVSHLNQRGVNLTSLSVASNSATQSDSTPQGQPQQKNSQPQPQHPSTSAMGQAPLVTASASNGPSQTRKVGIDLAI